MKKIILILVVVAFFQIGQAQSGRITYQTTEHFQLDSIVDESPLLADMNIPDQQSLENVLFFYNQKSLYRASDNDKKEEEDLDDEMFLNIGGEEEGILYIDHSNKTKVHQTNILGRPFTIRDRLNKKAWKITTEKISYLGYECTKAIQEDSLGKVVAWFTPQLPMGYGPEQYNGLPGTILMLSADNGMIQIKATDVALEEVADSVVPPSKGKTVTQAEFDRIYKEKMEELFNESGQNNGNIKIIDMRN